MSTSLLQSPAPPGLEASPLIRLPGLDLVRATAISLVVLQHGMELLVNPSQPWAHWILFGRFGVEIFFVLSGFLVGGMILRTGEALAQPRVLAGFLVGRWMRTLPLYYFILLVRQVLRLVVYDTPLESWQVLGRYVFFLQNLAWPMPAYFIESWSLAIEEWFYLLLPLLVWAAVRAGFRGLRAFWLGTSVLLVVPMVIRLLASQRDDAQVGSDLIVVQRLDAIAWGVLAAVCAMVWPVLWERLRRPALFVGLLLGSTCYAFAASLGANTTAWVRMLYPAVVSLSIALILPWAATFTVSGRSWWLTAVEWVARWSYSLYLTNLLVATLMFIHVAAAHPEAGWAMRWTWMGLYVLITLAVSAVLYRWIESPLMARRKKVGVYRAFTTALHR